MWGLLAGLLWVGTFIMMPTQLNGFWMPKDACWLVGSLLLASSPFWNAPHHQTLPNRWIGFFLIYLILMFGFLVLWPQLRQPGPNHMRLGVSQVWNVMPILPTLTAIGSLLALDALIRHTDRLDRWHRIALHLVWIGSLIALIAIGQWTSLDPFAFVLSIGWIERNSPITVFGNPMITGNFLALCAPLTLMFRAKRYRWGAFWLMISAIILTQSATSLFAVWLASAVIWMGHRKRILACGWLIGGGLFVWQAWQSGTLTSWLNPHGRLEMWQTAWAYWISHPVQAWLGNGLGSVGALTARGVWSYGYLHNDLFQLFFQCGLIGGTCGLFALGVTAYRTWQAPHSASWWTWVGTALSYAVIASFSFPSYIGTLLMVGIVIWAALESHAQQREVSYGQGYS